MKYHLHMCRAPISAQIEIYKSTKKFNIFCFQQDHKNPMTLFLVVIKLVSSDIEATFLNDLTYYGISYTTSVGIC